MKFVPIRLLKLVGWTTGAYAASWVLRIGQQVILTRLLSPELFGMMMIILTLRTGIDLFTDIGVGQNVVNNKHAEERDFYDTAWTLQVLRGVVLCLFCCAAAIPLARFYDAPILTAALPAASIYFIFGGLGSISRFLLQKRLDVVRMSLYEVAITAMACIANIVCALISPTIWALVWGSVLSVFAGTVASYFLIPGMRHRLFLSREYSRQIFGFGKWVFVSTIVYFLSTNFDRLYMAKVLPLAVLGIYGIGRSLTDLMSVLMIKFGGQLVFPIVASSGLTRTELHQRIARVRFRCLAVAALATSVFPLASGVAIHLIYDARYHGAAAMMPLLSIGVWFAMLCTLNESVLLGIGKPVYGAIGNAVKFVALCIALPLGIAYLGIAGAIIGIVVAEAARYVPLWAAQKREHLSFARHDAILTIAMLALFAGWLALLWLAGWASYFPLLPTGTGTLTLG